jgi:hypothetical protein
MRDGERTGEFGPVYLPALRRIRDLWLDIEPLVDDTGYDDPVSPTELLEGGDARPLRADGDGRRGAGDERPVRDDDPTAAGAAG